MEDIRGRQGRSAAAEGGGAMRQAASEWGGVQQGATVCG